MLGLRDSAFAMTLDKKALNILSLTSKFMSKMKSILVLSAAAMCLSATPSFAQYGSGSSANNLPSSSSTARRAKKVKSTVSKAEKRRQKALREKEAMEAKLAQKEKGYGSGTAKPVESYGSGTPKPAASYGPGTAQPAKSISAAPVKPAQAYGSGHKGGAVIKKERPSSYGSGHSTSGATLNCPAGTTPQANGSCLLTSGSLPTG